MSDNQRRETVSVKEFAKALGLHPNTVYQMVRDSRAPITPLHVASRKILFRRTDVDALLQGR